jgi:predicted TIM-barrel fold metal-dependent hydrolase
VERDSTPLVIVSSDTHIGPRLEEQLRQYCPERYRREFDAFAEQVTSARAMMRRALAQSPRVARNQKTDGHHDVYERLRDLDYDGVAAEVIFHGSQNGEPIPFQSFGPFLGYEKGDDLELLGVGYRIYNQWLADFCSVEPERHVGLAHLPMWDVDAAVREAEWARRAGLRGVNFPAPKPFIQAYNDPVWEPFWSVCEDLGLTLGNHGGAGNPSGGGAPGANEVMVSELSALSHVSPVNQLVFGGVFEQHPKLRLVLTELPGTWWRSVLTELDSIYLLNTRAYGPDLAARVPRLPSDYCREQVFLGASFLSRFEAEHAVECGYESNVIWGSDYPHAEGTFQYPDDWNDEPLTRVAMRYTFAEVRDDAIRAMVGQNGVRAYGLDGDALAQVARRIGAPTCAELSVPVETIPEDGGLLAFRQLGAWA